MAIKKEIISVKIINVIISNIGVLLYWIIIMKIKKRKVSMKIKNQEEIFVIYYS